MRLVSENSATQVAHTRRMVYVARTLQVLTANLMRVTRGAGKPYEIGEQAQDVVEAIVACRNEVGHYPSSDDIASTLSAQYRQEVLDQLRDEQIDEVNAEMDIINGALQMVASRILRQARQESAGRSQMYAGVRERKRILDEKWRKWDAEDKRGAATAPKRARKTSGSGSV